jgi:hypothetical protein
MRQDSTDLTINCATGPILHPAQNHLPERVSTTSCGSRGCKKNLHTERSLFLLSFPQILRKEIAILNKQNKELLISINLLSISHLRLGQVLQSCKLKGKSLAFLDFLVFGVGGFVAPSCVSTSSNLCTQLILLVMGTMVWLYWFLNSAKRTLRLLIGTKSSRRKCSLRNNLLRLLLLPSLTFESSSYLLPHILIRSFPVKHESRRIRVSARLATMGDSTKYPGHK